MRPLLLDTSAYSAFKRGSQDVLELLRHAEIIVMNPVVLGELLSGFDGGQRSQKNKMELREFLGSPRVQLYPITSDTAQFYTQVYQSLKLKGTPIPTNDMWIAASALEQGCVVCTYDQHFSLIEGLTLIQTLSDCLP